MIRKNVIELKREILEERAAVRQFEGEQNQVEAENGAIVDVMGNEFQDLSKIEQETLLDVFRTLLGWSQDLEGSKK